MSWYDFGKTLENCWNLTQIYYSHVFWVKNYLALENQNISCLKILNNAICTF